MDTAARAYHMRFLDHSIPDSDDCVLLSDGIWYAVLRGTSNHSYTTGHVHDASYVLHCYPIDVAGFAAESDPFLTKDMAIPKQFIGAMYELWGTSGVTWLNSSLICFTAR